LVLCNSRLAKPAVWTFDIFGSLDLLTAITFATIYNAPVTMGPAYWIPAFWVSVVDALRDVRFIGSALGILRRFRSQPQVLTRRSVG